MWLLLGSLLIGGTAYALVSAPSAPTTEKKSPSSTLSSPGSSGQVLAPKSPSSGQATSSSSSVGAQGTNTQASDSQGSNSQGSNSQGSSPKGSDNCNPNGNCDKTFGVTVGNLGGLYPGAARQLPVRFDNPNNFDINVDSYTMAVSVPAAVASTCPARNLIVPNGTVRLSPAVSVTKNAGTNSSVPVALAATAPDACQRVSFTVTVSATAVKK